MRRVLRGFENDMEGEWVGVEGYVSMGLISASGEQFRQRGDEAVYFDFFDLFHTFSFDIPSTTTPIYPRAYPFWMR